MNNIRQKRVMVRVALRTLFPVFFLVLLSLTLHSQDKFTLVFKYQQGEIYKYRGADTFISQQEVNGQEMKIGGGSNSLVSMEVTSVAPDSSITFITSYNEMNTYVKSPFMDTVIDRIDKTGMKAKVLLDRFGRETSLEMPDSAGISFSGISMNMGSYHAASFFQLPVHPVAYGERWNGEIHDSTANGDGYTEQKGSIEYTLTGQEQKNGRACLKIAFYSKGDHSGKMNQMGMDVVFEGTVDTRGTIWFDAAAGIMVCRESDAIQEMTIVLTSPMTMSVPMSQSIKSTYSLVEK